MSSYQEALTKTNEYGVTEELRHPLILVRGLPGATIDEVVIFENGQKGHVFALSKDFVEVLSLSDESISPGTKVARTGTHLTIEVSDALCGQVINPLGESLTTEHITHHDSEHRLLDVEPPHIDLRCKITKPISTGTALVDLLIPLGQGQRQMILGDQKTGKTSFLLSTIESCATDNLVIYAAIGKPWNTIAEVNDVISSNPEIKKNTIIVAGSASDVPSMIVLTPFTAMSIAEYFRDKGRNVIVIMDDLSIHATAYREISLLAKRFPGRESYPGDIFHLHAKLLERAGNFRHDKTGEAAITCLPVAETVHNNLTSYIVSNLISITDGHLLFDTTIFNQGRRPSIDTALSVTRVGRQTQNKLYRQLRQEIMSALTQYYQAQNYSQFGAELNQDLQDVLTLGNKLIALFSQPPVLSIPATVQTILVAIIIQGSFDDKPDKIISEWRDCLIKNYTGDKSLREMLDNLTDTDSIHGLISNIGKHQEKIFSLCQAKTL